MRAFECRLVHRAFNFSQSKLLLSLPALPLLLLLLGNSGALVVSLLGAVRAIFEGSASVFLLVNCVIATIFASSRLKSSTAREACKEKNVTINEGDQCRDASEKKFVLATNDEEICGDNQDEEVLIREPGDDNQDQQVLIRGTGEDNQLEELALRKEAEIIGDQEELVLRKEAENGNQEEQAVFRVADHGEDDVLNSGKNEVLITRAGGDDNHAPSAEEVWTAIVSGKKGRTVLTKESDKHVKVAEEGAGAAVALKMAESGAKKLNETDEEGDPRELEELNRRSEEFIARVNQQMRLQRLESLQRRRQRRSLRCYPHQRHNQPPHLRRMPPPAASLLVG